MNRRARLDGVCTQAWIVGATALLCMALPVTSARSQQTQSPTPQVTLHVFAAGSLRAPMTSAAKAFETAHPHVAVALTFGASGLLRERIEAGTPADVFASANMAHPQRLSATGEFGATRRFARNELCGLARADLVVTPDTLVATLLDPAIKLGTSTPKADPSGDYAFEVFERIETTGAGPVGSARQLAAKALQLTGGPNSPAPPAGRSVYGQLVADGRADLFLTYCTNAAAAHRQQPELQVIDLPVAINVGADYGVAVRAGAPTDATAFADALVDGPGQVALREAGFKAP
ncbi:MAG: molybdate ABC transporter substrate-binding protein [Burkholderiales bacterium]